MEIATKIESYTNFELELPIQGLQNYLTPAIISEYNESVKKYKSDPENSENQSDLFSKRTEILRNYKDKYNKEMNDSDSVINETISNYSGYARDYDSIIKKVSGLSEAEDETELGQISSLKSLIEAHSGKLKEIQKSEEESLELEKKSIREIVEQTNAIIKEISEKLKSEEYDKLKTEFDAKLNTQRIQLESQLIEGQASKYFKICRIRRKIT